MAGYEHYSTADILQNVHAVDLNNFIFIISFCNVLVFP